MSDTLLTEEFVNRTLDQLSAARKEQFGKNEEIYKLLGRAMGALMDIRTALRK